MRVRLLQASANVVTPVVSKRLGMADESPPFQISYNSNASFEFEDQEFFPM
jgi:hypothetical protein